MSPVLSIFRKITFAAGVRSILNNTRSYTVVRGYVTLERCLEIQNFSSFVVLGIEPRAFAHPSTPTLL